MNTDRPRIREDKCRFNITLPKKHKEHLERIAEKLGISLNSLFVLCAMSQYPINNEEYPD